MRHVTAGVRSTHSQDGAVVLDIRHGLMFNLNFVGSRILELLEQGHPESQIAEKVSREFGVAREIAEADVREFLDSLQKHRLVEFRDTHGPL